ncbi:glycosyltransferase [Bizionia paragorgiae]|uniref:glycosyltransferase n=1 Tax=Bizionia paragorgiae TaxID=283786 RepID=UPI003A8CACEF
MVQETRGVDLMVSVVMITYGHEHYIKQAIDGVLMQNVSFGIELIIADDTSPDNTENIVNKIIKSHPNGGYIKYTKHTKNKGMMPNFIWALQQSKGKYIALCEGDDYWTDPLKLQKQVDFMESKPEMVFSFHNVATINEKNESGLFFKFENFKDRTIIPKNRFIAKGGGGFGTASTLFKKEIIEDLPDYFKEATVGDMPLALLAISKGEIGYLEENMACYRLMSSSSWSKNINNEQRLKNNENVRITLKKFHEETNNQFVQITKKLNQNIYYHYGLYYSYKSQLKKIPFIANNFFKLGFVNMLKLLKNNL